jgi:hypothetical protein
MFEFIDLCLLCGYYLSEKGEHIIYDGTYTLFCDHGEESRVQERRRKARELMQRLGKEACGN